MFKYSSIAVLLFSLSLLFVSCSDEDDPSEPQHEHFEAEGWIFEDAAGRDYIVIYEGKFDNSGIATEFIVPFDDMTDHFEIYFLDHDKDEINPPDDDDKKLGWVIGDESIVEVHRHDDEEWEFHLKGLKVGETDIEFQIVHNDHADVKTIKIPVKVQ